METTDWSSPQDVLAQAVEVLRAPLTEHLPRLSRVLGELAPHLVLAQLSGVCAYAPVQAIGEPELAGRVTGAELGRLAGLVPVGRPWQGQAVLAGALRPVLAAASVTEGGNGALLALIRSGGEPLDEHLLPVIQGIWDLATLNSGRRTAEAAPETAAKSRAVADARARAIGELTTAHTAVLAALLGTLRAPSLDDATARRGAVDLAVNAMIELRAEVERDRELSEEPADLAFTRLTEDLRPLLRYSPVRLDLRGPRSRGTLPADTAHAARATVRSAVLVMLEQDSLGRLFVGWQLDEEELRVTVRDDGPGTLTREALAVHRIGERLTALGGRLDLDGMPGWGTTITATLPLGAPATRGPAEPLDGLHPREVEVLGELALGRRNREIALSLHISESTVKFHVANILGKLGVTSRGAAAAFAHRAGLPIAS